MSRLLMGERESAELPFVPRRGLWSGCSGGGKTGEYCPRRRMVSWGGRPEHFNTATVMAVTEMTLWWW